MAIGLVGLKSCGLRLHCDLLCELTDLQFDIHAGDRIGGDGNLGAGRRFKTRGREFQIVKNFYEPREILGNGSRIALRRQDTALGDAFNKALKEIRANGTYKKINDKYFSFDVYGPETGS